MTAVVYGVGTSLFGKQPERSLAMLTADAVLEALAQAGISEVEAAYVGNVFGPPGLGQSLLSGLGLAGIPVLNVENTCASGTTAFAEAVHAVNAGRYERVLALGVEQMTAVTAGAIEPDANDAEGKSGLALPSIYAMAASRYMACYGLTVEDLAGVSVKNHRNALGNPRAQYRGDYTIAQVLSSRMISDPLTLLQCCPISDGAAAAVIGAPRNIPTDIRVLSAVVRSGRLWDSRSAHVWGYELIRDTARDAFEAAALGPADVDVLEVHDAFTIAELVGTEAIGLAPLGEGAKLVSSGHTAIGGAQPVNPSGGLLSRGHPVGCTGLAQVAEIVWQLRGEAMQRQVTNARIGLVETLGGGTSGLDGNGCVVAVLST
jgi:acetyl-CoA C-acetyltransferase